MVKYKQHYLIKNMCYRGCKRHTKAVIKNVYYRQNLRGCKRHMKTVIKQCAIDRPQEAVKSIQISILGYMLGPDPKWL